MALLSGSSTARGTPTTEALPTPSASSPRRDSESPIPPLVIEPYVGSNGMLLADHSSHSSHSSHVSGSTTDPGDVDPSSSPAPSPSPAPYTPPPTYSPPPVYSPSTPPPAPATPEMPVDFTPDMLEKLSRIPALWPKLVRLRVSYTFTLMIDGKATGTFDAPAGSWVAVLKVEGAKLLVSFHDGQAEVPSNFTNIGNIVSAQALIDAPTPPPDPNPPAAPTGSSSTSNGSSIATPPASSPSTSTGP